MDVRVELSMGIFRWIINRGVSVEELIQLSRQNYHKDHIRRKLSVKVVISSDTQTCAHMTHTHTHTHTHIYIYICVCVCVYIYIYIATFAGNGHGNTSSYPGRDWLHFT